MSEQEKPLRPIQGLEATRHVANAERLTVRSIYALIRRVAVKAPEQTAITLHVEGERSDRPARLSYGALLKGMHQTANLLADLGARQSFDTCTGGSPSLRSLALHPGMVIASCWLISHLC